MFSLWSRHTSSLRRIRSPGGATGTTARSAASCACTFKVGTNALSISCTHRFCSWGPYLRFSCCKAPEREALSSAIPGYTDLLSRLCPFSCHAIWQCSKETKAAVGV